MNTYIIVRDRRSDDILFEGDELDAQIEGYNPTDHRFEAYPTSLTEQTYLCTQ